MLERMSTPPLPVDESKYLVVVHPYPLNANLELHADQRALALWLACCASKDVLRAIFYKPSSPEMVVIEVDREFDRFHELLGRHVWSDFLREPNKEQMDKSSTVFYSTFNTSRLVNTGWKQVNIEEHWFQGWTTENSIIRHPYPESSHCNVSSRSEAKSSAPACRLLPQRGMTVPPPPPSPPGDEEDQPRKSTVADFVNYSATSGIGRTRPWVFDDPEYDPWNPPADAAGGRSRAGAANLREGYDTSRLEPPTKVKKNGKWTCPRHGSLSPGICEECVRIERANRIKDAREKWEQERRQREAQRARDRPNSGRKKAEAMGEGENDRSSQQPRLCRNESSSTSTSSGSDSDNSHKQGSTAPPRADGSIPRNTGGTDTQPTVGSAFLAWDLDPGWYAVDDDDEDDNEGASVAWSLMTNVSSGALSRSRSSSPSSVSSSEFSNVSIPSTTWSSGSESTSLSGNSRLSTADTQWGDPIAKEDSRKNGGREMLSKSARKRRNKARHALAQAQAQEQAARASLLEAALDVELPPGGPGTGSLWELSWGDPNEAW